MNELLVMLDNFVHRTHTCHASEIQAHTLVAHLFKCRHVVGNDDQCAVALPEIDEVILALLLKAGVAYAQYFIDKQDIRRRMDDCGKSETRDHAGEVCAQGDFDCVSELGKLHDLLEHAPDFLQGHPQDRAIKKENVTSRQLRMGAST